MALLCGPLNKNADSMMCDTHLLYTPIKTFHIASVANHNAQLVYDTKEMSVTKLLLKNNSAAYKHNSFICD
jgi:hypothetical protein